MSSIRITALSFVLCSGLADACDTFTISGRVVGQGADLDTWIGVFQDRPTDRAEPVGSAWSDAGEFELDVPCAEPLMLLAAQKGAVPLAKRISRSTPTVELRFVPGLSLTGSVHTDEKIPIGGARVSITRMDEAEVRLPESLTTWHSSEDGTFVAGGLAPGTYRIAATADGHMPVELPEVVVAEGAANQVDIRLPTAFFIAGRVVDPSGLGVAGAEIHAAQATGASDSEGAFRIGPFRKGQRVFVLARSGLSRSDGADFLAPRDDLFLTLNYAVDIRGSVSNAFTGEPLDDFALAAYDGEVRSFAFRGAKGQFSAVVSGHTHYVVISAPGLVSWYTHVDFGSGGGEHDFGDVALEPERIVTGQVLDAASGLPVRAWVRRTFDMHDYRRRFEFDLANRVAPAAWTNEDGRFSLTGLPGDDVRIEAGSPGYGPEVVGVPAGTHHVEIEVAVVGATIEGMLVTDEGTPAEGEVLLSKVRGKAESRRVEKGRFSFEIAAKANDRYLLVGRSAMGRVERRQLTIRHDNESVTGIRLIVRRLGRVSGLLAGLDTNEAATLLVVDGGGQAVQASRSSGRRYSVHGIPAGRFTLRVRTTSGRAIAREFESDGLGETVVDLVLTGASSLGGVVTAGGRPISGVDVEATPLDKALTSGESRTMGNGAYAINGLDDGEYVVRVRGRSFGVELSGETYYDLELGPLAISGTVRAEGPVRGALVTATPTTAGGSGGDDQVDSRGSFRIDGLAEGEYTVRVSHTGHQETSQTVYLGSAIENFDIYLSPTDGR